MNRCRRPRRASIGFRPDPIPRSSPRSSTPPYEVRRVSTNDGVRWHKRWVNLSHGLGEVYIGFVEVNDGEWDRYFGAIKLGRFHERLLKVEESCRGLW